MAKKNLQQTLADHRARLIDIAHGKTRQAPTAAQIRAARRPAVVQQRRQRAEAPHRKPAANQQSPGDRRRAEARKQAAFRREQQELNNAAMNRNRLRNAHTTDHIIRDRAAAQHDAQHIRNGDYGGHGTRVVHTQPVHATVRQWGPFTLTTYSSFGGGGGGDHEVVHESSAPQRTEYNHADAVKEQQEKATPKPKEEKKLTQEQKWADTEGNGKKGDEWKPDEKTLEEMRNKALRENRYRPGIRTRASGSFHMTDPKKFKEMVEGKRELPAKAQKDFDKMLKSTVEEHKKLEEAEAKREAAQKRRQELTGQTTPGQGATEGGDVPRGADLLKLDGGELRQVLMGNPSVLIDLIVLELENPGTLEQIAARLKETGLDGQDKKAPATSDPEAKADKPAVESDGLTRDRKGEADAKPKKKPSTAALMQDRK